MHGIQKRLPNSNVVLELGYAMSAVGTDRIICVVNEARGTVDELFFDLAHRRRPICYTLSTKDDAAKEDILKQLTTQFRSAIKAIVESGALAVPSDEQRQDRLVVEQFWSVVGLFWARLRLLLYGMGQATGLDERIQNIFGLNVALTEGAVDVDSIDKEVIYSLFSSNDFSAPSNATPDNEGHVSVCFEPGAASRGGTIPWSKWLLAEVAGVEAGCDKLLVRFGSGGKGEIIEQLSLMHNRADALSSMAKHIDFQTPTDSQLLSIWHFFEHLILSTQLIERFRQSYPKPQ